MGFFSDLKEDLSQAVNELMPEDEKSKTDESADESAVSLDEMLKNIDEFQLPEEKEAESQEAGQSEATVPEVQEESDAEMEKLLEELLGQSPDGEQEPQEETVQTENRHEKSIEYCGI